MIDNIKDLHGRINDKKKAVRAVSEKCGIKPSSVEKNWFSSFWSIPEKHQGDVVDVLQNQLRQQIKDGQKALEDIEVIGHVEIKDKN